MLVRNNNGKVVGEIIGDLLKKTVSGNKHMLRNPPAWGFDKAIIEKARALGVSKIQIHDKDDDKNYEITMEKFWKHSFLQNRGHGEQYFAPLSIWQHNKKEMTLF